MILASLLSGQQYSKYKCVTLNRWKNIKTNIETPPTQCTMFTVPCFLIFFCFPCFSARVLEENCENKLERLPQSFRKVKIATHQIQR